MGLPGLWDEIGDGQVISIATYASKHFEEHRRPLRIAIDAAAWRFNNLNLVQVAIIREKEPAANPVEKLIYYRIRRLLRFNVRLLFVFDGPRRPHKRGRPAGRIPWGTVALLKKLLQSFQIPIHDAPAEAEADCAALQVAGKVDVVWSEDGDTLMFGCTTLITNYRTPKKDGKGTQKDDELVSLYTADRLKRDHQITQEGLVLFAMTGGGDYDTTGVPGCGPKLALNLAKDTELAHDLCTLSQFGIAVWRDRFESTMRHHRPQHTIEIPPDFPRIKILEKYRNPIVTNLAELRTKQFQWEIPFNEAKLRQFMRDRFNVWTHGYQDSIGTILLVRTLASTPTGQEAENNKYCIKLKRTMKKQNADGMPQATTADAEQVLTKVTFDPTLLCQIDIVKQPANEDWARITKGGKSYGPQKTIEAEIPTIVLKRGFGIDWATSLGVVARKSRNRNVVPTDDAEDEPSIRLAKKVRMTKSDLIASQSWSETSDSNEKPRNRERDRSKSVNAQAPAPSTASEASMPMNSTAYSAVTVPSQLRTPMFRRLQDTDVSIYPPQRSPITPQVSVAALTHGNKFFKAYDDRTKKVSTLNDTPEGLGKVVEKTHTQDTVSAHAKPGRIEIIDLSSDNEDARSIITKCRSISGVELIDMTSH